MIEFKNTSFVYGDNKYGNGIYNINLKIAKGEFLVVTGPSGCGKTTLTRLINGLCPNYYNGILEGNILINNKEILDCSIYDISKIVGSVFQNPRSQFFNVDTTSELAFYSENQGIEVNEIKRRVENTVKNFSIEVLMGRNIFKLSGGEKQKIACASVAVAEPDIIVLDEPSSNLDVNATRDLKRVLELWKSQGKTIIIAEHRLYFLRELLDKMIVMNNGKIIEEFTGNEVRLLSQSKVSEKKLRALNIDKLKYNNNLIKGKSSNFVIKNLFFLYKDSNRGININKLELNQGGIIAVIGDNGAGKSTFVKCLCGLEKSCKAILLKENRIYKNKDRLKRCYMVMQDVNHQLFTESVLDEVILSMSDNKEIDEDSKKKRAYNILESMDLEQYIDIHPMALSGGEKQRVAIASAIAADRNIIIFDEPTSGLDYEHMKQVSENLKKLSEMQKTLFVITHDLELILRSCTEVLHLENGKVKDFYSLGRDNEEKIKDFFLQREREELLI